MSKHNRVASPEESVVDKQPRRCRVEASVLGVDFSVRLGPGSYHDLDEVLDMKGTKLRDVVDEAWFEPLDKEEKV